MEDGGRLEWHGAGRGGGNGTILLPGFNSTMVFRWEIVTEQGVCEQLLKGKDNLLRA